MASKKRLLAPGSFVVTSKALFILGALALLYILFTLYFFFFRPRTIPHFLTTPANTLTTSKSATSISLELVRDPVREAPLKITCVLLHWKRTRNLIYLGSLLRKKPYIAEIIIWNNNPNIILSHAEFQFDETAQQGYGHLAPIRIINSPNNLHDLAKYLGCSMASTEYCYLQDDDFDNQYMDSMYATFVRYPHLIVANTLAPIHHEQTRFTFYKKEINLHTRFSWLGCGSYFERAKASQFLKQLSMTHMPQKDLLVADMFFTIWTNDYPLQFENELKSVVLPPELKRLQDEEEAAKKKKEEVAWSARIDEWDVVYTNMLRAARTLYTTLQDSTQQLFPDQETLSPPFHLRDIRCPCSNDKCTFLTNLQTMPDPESVSFDPEIKSMKDQEKKYETLNTYPDSYHWNMFPYHRAVDGQDATCWKYTRSAVPRGSYFGLDLLKIRDDVDEITVAYDPEHKQNTYKFADRLEIWISQTGELEPSLFRQHWKKVDYTFEILADAPGQVGHRIRYRLLLSKYSSSNDKLESFVTSAASDFRFIRFVITSSLDFPIHVCELKIENI